MKQKFVYDFKNMLEEMVDKSIARWIRKPPGQNPWHALGNVVDVATLPTVHFDADTAPSGKRYAYVEAYTAANPPVAGDRVYMVRGGNDWIVLGKIKT